MCMEGFPSDPVVKNPPARVKGDTGSILFCEDPTCHVASEPVHSYLCALEPVLLNKRSPRNEDPVQRTQPLLATEEAQVQQRRHSTAQN